VLAPRPECSIGTTWRRQANTLLGLQQAQPVLALQ
jgi:hypothetical protein